MSGYKSIKKLMKEEEPYIYGLSKNAFMSGIKPIDDLTGGFGKGELICVAGSPSMGKTLFMLGVIANTCIYGKGKCLYFNLGQSNYEFLERLTGIASGNQYFNWSKNKVDRMILDQSVKQIKKAGIYVNYKAYSIDKIEKVCKKAASECQIDMIVIDYLQLIRGERSKSGTEMSYVVSRLKQLARRMKCPVIVLSRLIGKEQHRKDHRPRMSDLDRNTGLTCYADKILFLYRDGYYNIDPTAKKEMDITIAKNTAGGIIGTVTLSCKPGCSITRRDGDLCLLKK